jgi:signal recognition particle subunit SRP54
MIPGLPADMLAGSDEEGSLRMKRMIFITDSMTAAELDSDGTLFMEHSKDGKPVGLTWRVTRVAKGSGTSVREVEEVLCQYRMMANMAKQAGGKNGWLVAYFNSRLSSFFSPIWHIKVTSHAENAISCWWSWSGC